MYFMILVWRHLSKKREINASFWVNFRVKFLEHIEPRSTIIYANKTGHIPRRHSTKDGTLDRRMQSRHMLRLCEAKYYIQNLQCTNYWLLMHISQQDHCCTKCCFLSIRPYVRPSVYPSVCPSVCPSHAVLLFKTGKL